MERMEYYEKNMKVLQERDEAFYQAILAYELTESECYLELVLAKDGTGITRLTMNGKAWYLNSQYRPLQEAVTFAEQYHDVIDYSFMIFFGFGNGVIARQIRKEMGNHVRMLFYEPSAEIFLHTIHNYDISDLLGDADTELVVKSLNDEKLVQVLTDNITFENYKLAIYDAFPKYRQLFSEQYQYLEDKYQSAVYDIIINLNTSQDFGRSMVVNCIQNLKHLLNCNYRDDFIGRFPTDMPAVVVAAGPSLEKNVQILKKMKGKAFIVAVDRALGYLVKEGIRPDLAVTVDPRKSIRLFESEDVQNMLLAIDSSANYQAADLLSKNKLIFSGGNYVYYRKMFEMAGRDFRFLENGGSVATIAFSLLREWGFQRIVLVGQDLALTPEKVHAGNEDTGLQKLNQAKIAIEGYYGDVVYTTGDYEIYRRWFEERMEKEDCPEVINATEGGAKITGAVQMPLQEVLDRYCEKEFDFEQAIQDVPIVFEEADRVRLLAAWNDSIRNLEQLKRKLKEGIRLAEEQVRLVQRGSYTKGKMRDLQKRMNKILEECDSYDETQFVDSMIAAEEAGILDDIYEMEPSNDEEHCRLLDKLKKYMVSLVDAVDEVKGLFQTVIDEMAV